MTWFLILISMNSNIAIPFADKESCEIAKNAIVEIQPARRKIGMVCVLNKTPEKLSDFDDMPLREFY